MLSASLTYIKTITALTLLSTALVGCGGGANTDAVPGVPVSTTLSSTPSVTANSSLNTTSTPASIGSSKANSSVNVSTASSKLNSSVNVSTASSKLNSSVVNTSTGSKSSSVASSKAISSAASSKAISSAASSKAPGALGATIEWSHPAARENGAYLELTEIGGYQIRYKSATATDFNYITITGNTTTRYLFKASMVGLVFEIAVFDNAGLYSDFVKIVLN